MPRSKKRVKWLVTPVLLLTCAQWPAGARADAKIEEKLNKLITLDKEIAKDTALKDAMELLGKRYDVRIVINDAEFKKQLKIFNIEQFPVSLPKMPALQLGLIVELL